MGNNLMLSIAISLVIILTLTVGYIGYVHSRRYISLFKGLNSKQKWIYGIIVAFVDTAFIALIFSVIQLLGGNFVEREADTASVVSQFNDSIFSWALIDVWIFLVLWQMKSIIRAKGYHGKGLGRLTLRLALAIFYALFRLNIDFGIKFF